MVSKKPLKLGWSYKKLEELGFLGRGKSKHRPRNDSSLYGGKYPFIQTGEVKSADLYISKYSKTYNEKGLAQSKLWNSGTLLLTIAANVSETAILKIEACFPDSIVGFIADPKISDVRFVKYYIDTIKLQMQSISRGTTQDNLSLEKIRSFDFLIPPLPIQQKIAAILSAYDDLIENNTRRIEILESMARMLYREWFVKFRYPGHESDRLIESELGLIPEGWEVVKLGKMASFTTGKLNSNAANPEGIYPFFTCSKEIFKTDTYSFNTECVLLAGNNANGIFHIHYFKGKFDVYQRTYVIRTLSEKEVTNKVLFFIIRDKVEHLKSISTGAATKFLTLTILKNLLVILPDSKLQTFFSNCINPLFKEIELLKIKNNNLRQTRDLLLPRLISGEIDV